MNFSQSLKVSKRNNAVDVIRVIAAFGVIAIHVKCSTYGAAALNLIFWPLSVPFFYVISLTFFVDSLEKNSIKETFRKIWWRITVPYLAWTFIYSALLFTKSLITGKHWDFVFWRLLFYGESAVHLYFIPTLIFLQVTTLSIYLIVKNRKKNRSLLYGISLLVLATIYLVVGISHQCFGVPSIGCLIGIVIYISAALLLSDNKNINDTNKRYYLCLGFVLLMAVVACDFLGYLFLVANCSLLLPLGGISLLLVSIGMPDIQIPRWLSVLSGLSYGIYLCHVMFLEAFEFYIGKKYPEGITYNFAVRFIVVTGIFACSVLFLLIIRRVSFFKIILLGEKK